MPTRAQASASDATIWAGGMSEAIRRPTGYGVWDAHATICKSSFPSVALPTHSSYPCPSSEPWQPLLGSSPEPAHSAGPGAPAAAGAPSGRHFRPKTAPLSRDTFLGAAGPSQTPLREPTGPVWGASWGPPGLIFTVLRATLGRSGCPPTSLRIKQIRKPRHTKNIVKHIGF